jgi:hypothetical protein
MDKEFCPYEQALALKELGFDEPCLGNYRLPSNRLITEWEIKNTPEHALGIPAPLYQQAFRWFREKCGYLPLIKYDGFEIIRQNSTSTRLDKNTGRQVPLYSTQTYHRELELELYEELELECLKKLIEIVGYQK